MESLFLNSFFCLCNFRFFYHIKHEEKIIYAILQQQTYIKFIVISCCPDFPCSLSHRVVFFTQSQIMYNKTWNNNNLIEWMHFPCLSSATFSCFHRFFSPQLHSRISTMLQWTRHSCNEAQQTELGQSTYKNKNKIKISCTNMNRKKRKIKVLQLSWI